MKLVNVSVPKELEKRMARLAQKNYRSTGEFVRSSIVRLLSRQDILPQAAKIDLLRKTARQRMQKRKELFEPERELRELKKTRGRVYHARRS